MKSIDFINKVPKQVAESTAVEQPINKNENIIGDRNFFIVIINILFIIKTNTFYILQIDI